MLLTLGLLSGCVPLNTSGIRQAAQRTLWLQQVHADADQLAAELRCHDLNVRRLQRIAHMRTQLSQHIERLQTHASDQGRGSNDTDQAAFQHLFERWKTFDAELDKLADAHDLAVNEPTSRAALDHALAIMLVSVNTFLSDAASHATRSSADTVNTAARLVKATTRIALTVQRLRHSSRHQATRLDTLALNADLIDSMLKFAHGKTKLRSTPVPLTAAQTEDLQQFEHAWVQAQSPLQDIRKSAPRHARIRELAAQAALDAGVVSLAATDIPHTDFSDAAHN